MVDIAPYTGSDPVTARGTLQVKDLRSLSVKEALNAVCGSMKDLEDKHKFPNTDIAKKAPTVCTYVIANPKAFFEKPRMAKAYGVDVENIDPKTPLADLAKILPVIYVADVHTEYGTLGYQLNSRSANTMNDISPELRSFRQTPVYLGGQQNKGSSFTMVHNKVTDSRPFFTKEIAVNLEFASLVLLLNDSTVSLSDEYSYSVRTQYSDHDTLL